MLEELNPESLRVLDVAGREATSLGHDFTGTEHILLGLLLGDDDVAAPVLAQHGIVAAEVRSQLAGAGGVGSPAPLAPSLTARAKQVLALAGQESDLLGDDVVRPEHLLLGIIQQATGVAALMLRNLGIELDELRADVLQARQAYAGELVAAGVVPVDGPDGPNPGADGSARVSVGSTDGQTGVASGGSAGVTSDGSAVSREVAPPLCPNCGQLLGDVLATTTIAPSGSAGGRRRSYGSVTLIFCGACGHTLSATR